jgi:hypothetical protein
MERAGRDVQDADASNLYISQRVALRDLFLERTMDSPTICSTSMARPSG